MAETKQWQVWGVGSVVSEAEFKKQYGEGFERVLDSSLSEEPKTKKGERKKYLVTKGLPTSRDYYLTLRTQTFTSSVEDLVEDAFSVIEELAGEMREAFDNTPESLQQVGVGAARGEAADALEDIGGNRPDVPEAVSKVLAFFLPSDDLSSRARRATGAADMLATAASAIREYIDAQGEEKVLAGEQESGEVEKEPAEGVESDKGKESEKTDPIGPDLAELEELADTMESLASDIEGVEFPGMFG